MKEFEELWATTEHLLGPNGCPWDQVQTMISTRPCVIEEAAEVVEAIDSNDPYQIVEELGDLLFVCLFLCKLAEKEGKCEIKEVLKTVNEKLIRRHPHVFEEVKLNTSDEVVQQWEAIKKLEKGKTNRKGLFDGIPTGLPALARAQKICKKLAKAEQFTLPLPPDNVAFSNEKQLGELLLSIVSKAQEQGLDAEHALRSSIQSLQDSYRS